MRRSFIIYSAVSSISSILWEANHRLNWLYVVRTHKDGYKVGQKIDKFEVLSIFAESAADVLPIKWLFAPIYIPFEIIILNPYLANAQIERKSGGSH